MTTIGVKEIKAVYKAVMLTADVQGKLSRQIRDPQSVYALFKELGAETKEQFIADFHTSLYSTAAGALPGQWSSNKSTSTAS